MMAAGLEIECYDAFEIDKYAVQTSTHNFPFIKHHGDVFEADFTEFKDYDYLVGGSPCTYWSIAQKNNRETEASGLGWELFSQYVRALREAQPKFFIYENNKSMAKAIKESITDTFGFEPILINSALVSAQNRQRLYWVGKREEDGTYSKIEIEQPEDRGILLKDILESGEPFRNEKAYCLDANYFKGGNLTNFNKQSGQRLQVAEPVNITNDGKSQTIKAQYYKNSVANFCCYTSTYGATGVAEPVCLRYERTEVAKKLRKQYENHEIHHGFNEFRTLQPRTDGKSNTVSTVQKDNMIAEPVRVGCYPSPDGTLKNSQGMRLYSTEGKSVNLTALGGGMGAKTGLYAIPVEYEDSKPVKAISCADGKTYQVYEVKDGLITIKDKQYPIKLTDGFYIIRKLTVRECMRLQTVPEWYQFPVSDTQAYKMLGNGWTVNVISHLLSYTKGRENVI